MKRILFLLTFFILTSVFELSAQIPSLTWNVHHSAKSSFINSKGPLIVQSDSNYIYMVGEFRDTLDFDPSQSISMFTASDQEDIYIQKFTKDGDMIWTKVLNGIGREAVPGFHVSNDGSLYLTGSFFGTVDFDPGTGSAISSFTPNPPYDQITSGSSVFILKLNSNGDYLWHHAFGEGSSHDGIRSIHTDSDGNVYCAATVHQRLGGSPYFDIDPTNSQFDTLSHYGQRTIQYKFDQSGQLIWSNIFTTQTQFGNLPPKVFFEDQTIDNSNHLISVGQFRGGIDFDPGNGIEYVQGQGSNSLFINKLDSSGSHIWTKTILANANQSGYNQFTHVITDHLNNIYVAGFTTDTLDIDPSSNTVLLTPGSVSLGFVIKYNQNGYYQHHILLSETEFIRFKGLTTDSANNLHIVGSFYGIATAAQIGSGSLFSNGMSDAFYISYDPNGNLERYISWGGNRFDYATSVSIPDENTIYVAGYFMDTVDFAPGTPQDIYISPTPWSTFLTRFDIFSVVSSFSNAEKSVDQLIVYPNPSQNEVQIHLDDQLTHELQIFSLQGSLIYYDQNYRSNKIIRVKDFPAGAYFIRLQDNETNRTSQFIKK